MKQILLVAAFVLALPAFASNSVEENTKFVMSTLGTSLDLAEGTLRVVLNKPTDGQEWNLSDKDRLDAALMLLNFEQRFPGFLQGRYGKTNWPQYEGVTAMYKELAKNEFFVSLKSDGPNVVELRNSLSKCQSQLAGKDIPSSSTQKLKENIERVIERIPHDPSEGKSSAGDARR